jgi:hypothetical protein
MSANFTEELPQFTIKTAGLGSARPGFRAPSAGAMWVERSDISRPIQAEENAGVSSIGALLEHPLANAPRIVPAGFDEGAREGHTQRP